MIQSITANTLQKNHLETFWEIFAGDGRKAVKIWDSKQMSPAARYPVSARTHRLYVRLSRLNSREITRLAARISEMDAGSDQHLCVLR